MRRLTGWLALVAGVLAAALFLLRTPDVPLADLKARYASADSRFVEVSPGFVVHLRDQGPRDAPALFLVHGSNASLHTWEPWVERLKGRYRVVSLDLQGHGLTGPTPSGCYTGACMADTVEAVRSTLGIERLAIAGNSMGGGVALSYALAHPDRVAALILVDSGGAPVRRDGPPPIGFRVAQMPVIRDIAAIITPRELIERTLDRSVSVKSVASPEAVDRYWELLRAPGNREATMQRFGQPRTEFDAKRLGALAGIPTLILWGEEDALIPVSAARWYADALPHARLVLYPGLGHIPQEETPDESAAEVARFLDQALMPPGPPSPGPTASRAPPPAQPAA
jgi:pimeloyl-ACP methyl ester carboxylesterase